MGRAAGRQLGNGVGNWGFESDFRELGAGIFTTPKDAAEVELPEALMGEFDLMVHEIVAGKRTRLEALEQEFKAIETRSLAGLAVIVEAVRAHPGTGQAGRLVAFLAGLYNGYDYPFDLSDLRPLDTKLANACLDYLNYDRLGICDLDKHLGGDRVLPALLREYAITPLQRETR
jgi:hypothetical protein